MKIVTGRGEKEHVSAKEHRRLYEGIVGSNDRILPCGEKMVPELVSNNLLRIRSGEMIHHGNVSSVENYDDVELTNGTQGMKRIDLVVNRYTRNAETEIEANEWIVLIGTPAESDPAIPAYTEGDLRNGDLVDDCPVFEVHYDGLNVAEVVQLLAVVKTIEELEAENTDLISKLSNVAIRGGSKIVTITSGSDAVVLFSLDQIRSLFGHLTTQPYNYTVSATNGDGKSSGHHLHGTTWLDNNLYVLSNQVASGNISTRVNYVIFYSP